MKETRELLDLLIESGNFIGKAMEDGKIGFSDAFYVLGVLKKIGPAVKGVQLVPAELQSATPEELDGLRDYIKKKFDIPQDKIEGVVEHALEILIRVAKLIGQFLP
jgi:hypothetical protein